MNQAKGHRLRNMLLLRTFYTAIFFCVLLIIILFYYSIENVPLFTL